MTSLTKRYIATAFIILAASVILGAFGAHWLKANLSEHYLGVFETANRYNFYQGLGMAITIFITSQHASQQQVTRLAILFLLSLMFFSGSLYLLSIAELLNMPGMKITGAIAPIGGIFMILSYAYAGKLIMS